MPFDPDHFHPASLDFFRLLLDFGLVVLIWLVQLIIYPSFAFVDRDRLELWHGRYTALISVVVVPLMLGQVLVVAMQVLQRGSVLDWISGALVAAVWLVTFLRAVPLHERIGQATDPDADIPALVWWNRPRTVLWTVIFVLGWMSAG